MFAHADGRPASPAIEIVVGGEVEHFLKDGAPSLELVTFDVVKSQNTQRVRDFTVEVFALGPFDAIFENRDPGWAIDCQEGGTHRDAGVDGRSRAAGCQGQIEGDCIHG